ncbi:MAG TPA: hypothetical protein VFV13_02265 [Acidimicrobiia bacterium]|nr:hypothetical protein [Acidimicrobiia bacterium]
MGGETVRIEETTVETTETHRLRSILIVLLIAALTFGVWYVLSERD